MKTLNHWYLHLFLILLSLSTIGVYFLFKNQTYFEFLIWNLFLAWIPYILAAAAYFIHTRKSTILKKFILIMVGLAWLLFLPNSPYVITDFIHLTILKDSYVQKGTLSFKYWYDFFIIFLICMERSITRMQLHVHDSKDMERAIQSLCFMADHRIDRVSIRVRHTFGKRISLKQLGRFTQ